jgi:hypothetical protein
MMKKPFALIRLNARAYPLQIHHSRQESRPIGETLGFRIGFEQTCRETLAVKQKHHGKVNGRIANSTRAKIKYATEP